PSATFECETLELLSLASVRACAQRVASRHRELHLLINNAGVMATPFERTQEGFELQFGVDHLAHFLFSCLLVDTLKAAAPARVVSLASRGHWWSDVQWEDPNFERLPYDKWKAYGQAKTANILFAVEFERRFGALGVNAYAVHPGAIQTELGRYLTEEDRARIEQMRQRAAAASPTPWKSIPQGAASTVWAATAPELTGRGGLYIEDCHIGVERQAGLEAGYAQYARNPDAARRLWELSERLVGLSQSKAI
ncbi:MAG: hypothetical protein ABW034_17335, partial [Steroidobacteraceae bacterium]